MRNRDAVDRLLSLGTPQRIAILSRLVEIEKPSIEDFWLQLIEREQEAAARWYILRAFGVLRSEASIDLLLEVGKDLDVELGKSSLYRIAAWSLGRIGMAALFPTLSALGASTEGCRVVAADALGEIRSSSAVGMLCKALREDTWKVKLWAALSLAKIGEPALDCLSSLSKGPCDPKISLLATDAMIKIGSPRALQELRTVVKSGVPEVRRLVLSKVPL